MIGPEVQQMHYKDLARYVRVWIYTDTEENNSGGFQQIECQNVLTI